MAKKGGLAVLLGLGKPEPGEMGGDSGLDASGDELADVLGISEGKRARFKMALKSYVEQCAAESDKDDGETIDSSEE